MNRHIEGGSSDYVKMTKAELIREIETQKMAFAVIKDRNADLRADYETLDAQFNRRSEEANMLSDRVIELNVQNEGLRDAYVKMVNSAPTYRPGWWLGVALFAAILIPWVLFGIWVMGS